MPAPLNPYPISAYGWLNALGAARWLGPASEVATDASPASWALERRGLTEAALDLPFRTFWGRVPGPLAELPAELRRHDSRCARLWYAGVEALREPLERAIARWGSARVGVIVGSSTGGIDRTEEALAHERLTGSLPSDYDFEAQHTYDALLRLTREMLGVEGPGYVISTACSSSGKAIAAAQRLLDAGLCDAVIAGGADALCHMTLRGFSSLGILSNEACKPFDAERKGITIGEGSAVLLIERESSSSLVVLSAGESGDAYHTTAPHPEGLGARLAIERALALADLAPEAVDYVNAHGTGTRQNDSAEAQAIAQALAQGVPFSSTKDRVGHQLGAAGATEAAFCLDALRLGTIPGNRPPSTPDAELATQPANSSRPIALRSVLSNSFAFGGSNVAVALGRRSERQAPRDVQLPGRAWLRAVAFWAPGYASLAALLERRHDDALQRPAAELLPVRARGRSSQLTRVAAELLGQLTAHEPDLLSTLPTVHGSAFGEMVTTRALLDQIPDPNGLSPAKFQASVHNTAGGQLSIATGNRAFSTALAAGDETVAMSLLEARAFVALHGGSIAVLVADEEASSGLMRGVSFPAAGVGFLLSWAEVAPPGSLGSLGAIERTASTQRGSALADGPLARTTAAWGLDLARAAALGESGQFALGPGWSVAFEPVRSAG
jgi:3-oxoacyl-[acyl-carrier-protein] synthase-1